MEIQNFLKVKLSTFLRPEFEIPGQNVNLCFDSNVSNFKCKAFNIIARFLECGKLAIFLFASVILKNRLI